MKKALPLIHHGGCLCGAVRYEVEGSSVIIAHCHCVACQRVTGAGHSTGAMFPDSKVRLTGRIGEYTYDSEHGNRVTKVFCPVCGSPILGHNTAMKGHVTMSLGTFDDSSDMKPQVAIFTRNQKPWDTMDPGLATFEAQPHWQPDDES